MGRTKRTLRSELDRRPIYRSPFRYPGGKTWLVPFVRRWLKSLREPLDHLIEPFAGGASVALTALFEGRAQTITLAEIDPNVASVWETILSDDAEWLMREISEFRMTRASVLERLSDRLTMRKERAFQTLLRNRVQRGGILFRTAGLLKRGERGKGLKSRWYPETLTKRIADIHARKHQICFRRTDALALLRERARAATADVAYFIDPPYTVAAKRLYTFSELDHNELFSIVDNLNGPVLMCYDDAHEISELAIAHNLATANIDMNTTHHTKKSELLISRELSWLHSSQLDG